MPSLAREPLSHGLLLARIERLRADVERGAGVALDLREIEIASHGLRESTPPEDATPEEVSRVREKLSSYLGSLPPKARETARELLAAGPPFTKIICDGCGAALDISESVTGWTTEYNGRGWDDRCPNCQTEG